MPNQQNHNETNDPTKAEVQTTKLNKLPVPGKFEPEFSAEEAAEVFKHNQPSNPTSGHQQ